MIRLSSRGGRHSRSAKVLGCCRSWCTGHPLGPYADLGSWFVELGTAGRRYKRWRQQNRARTTSLLTGTLLRDSRFFRHSMISRAYGAARIFLRGAVSI